MWDASKVSQGVSLGGSKALRPPLGARAAPSPAAAPIRDIMDGRMQQVQGMINSLPTPSAVDEVYFPTQQRSSVDDDVIEVPDTLSAGGGGFDLVKDPEPAWITKKQKPREEARSPAPVFTPAAVLPSTIPANESFDAIFGSGARAAEAVGRSNIPAADSLLNGPPPLPSGGHGSAQRTKKPAPQPGGDRYATPPVSVPSGSGWKKRHGEVAQSTLREKRTKGGK
eukprot:841102-Pyramimonas_sp.AAC.1